MDDDGDQNGDPEEVLGAACRQALPGASRSARGKRWVPGVLTEWSEVNRRRRRAHLHLSRCLIPAIPARDLVTAELTLSGRITTASNATFLGSIGEAAVVYKPIAGEQPRWDFSDGCLAHREVAAYLVSEALGWDIVPHTWLLNGQLGEGMVQLWQETHPGQTAVVLVLAEKVPDTRWKQVVQGQDETGGAPPHSRGHSHALRRMAVFRYGVDPGLTFHTSTICGPCCAGRTGTSS